MHRIRGCQGQAVTSRITIDGQGRNWPKFTKAQRSFLLDLERSKHGALQYGGRCRQTVYALLHHGVVKSFGPFNGVELTQRGKDYLRFGMRRKP